MKIIMEKLVDLIEILDNNETCVVLKVLPNSKKDLICLGFFTGNEVMLRLTKGGTQTCTVFYNDGTTFSWYWGYSGSTCVSDAVKKMGQMIQSCIENDLDIPVDGPPNKLKAGLKIQSKEDAVHATHQIEVMGAQEECVHKDNYYIAAPAGIENVISFFESFGYSVQGDIVKTKALNGCPVKTFKIVR